VNSLGQWLVYVKNCSAVDLGMVENSNGLQIRQLNAEYVNLVLKQATPGANKVFILENMNVTDSDENKDRYVDVISENKQMQNDAARFLPQER
jgi:hypothetical protein